MLAAIIATQAASQPLRNPETVTVRSGSLYLRGLLWRPAGTGPFRAILFNHGSGYPKEDLKRRPPYERHAEELGPVFARHGYVFLYLFRRGIGLSAHQGASAIDVMNNALAAGGQKARNAIQMKLLHNDDMSDALAGLGFLRSLREVDTGRIGIVGHSFGGSLTLLLAAREPGVRAVVVFGAAGLSWNRSPQLRQEVLSAAARIPAPLLSIYAANDYSVTAAEALDTERKKRGRFHRFKIYPALGRSVEEGHHFVYLGIPHWEADVFAFLNEFISN